MILLEHHGADQADDGGIVGEDADHIGTALDLRVQALERVGAVDLQAMRLGELHEGQDVTIAVRPRAFGARTRENGSVGGMVAAPVQRAVA